MTKSTKIRTWTLRGRSKQFGISFNLSFDKGPDLAPAIEILAPGQKNDDGDQTYLCSHVDPTKKSITFNRLWIDGVDDFEVTDWLRHTATGPVTFAYESAPEGIVVHFTFHNSNDALKFKLMFAEGLEAGAVAY